MIYSSWYHWHVCGFPVILIAVRMAAGNHSVFTIRTSLLGEKTTTCTAHSDILLFNIPDLAKSITWHVRSVNTQII